MIKAILTRFRSDFRALLFILMILITCIMNYELSLRDDGRPTMLTDRRALLLRHLDCTQTFTRCIIDS